MVDVYGAASSDVGLNCATGLNIGGGRGGGLHTRSRFFSLGNDDFDGGQGFQDVFSGRDHVAQQK